ncbi:MAG: hypothetical protein EOO99_10165 [Pedobacter sp.]|nr:MAG: hypothetical protein EOO99_10165 [Pedobacter sp.]
MNLQPKLQHIAYKDLWVRLGVSLTVAHIIVAHGHGFFKVMAHPAYVVSLLSSAVIAFGLFSMVKGVSLLLDRIFDWNNFLVLRLLTQLGIGVIVISYIAYLLAYGLFMVNEVDIHQTSYLDYDYYLIVGYIVMANVFYFVYYKFNVRAIIADDLIHFKNLKRHISMTTAPHHLNLAFLMDLNIDITEIACVYAQNGIVNNLAFNENITVEVGKHKAYFDEFNSNDYIRINRNCLMHRLLIENYKVGSSRRLILQVREPYNKLIPDSYKIVSQYNRKNFITKFKSVYKNFNLE